LIRQYIEAGMRALGTQSLPPATPKKTASKSAAKKTPAKTVGFKRPASASKTPLLGHAAPAKKAAPKKRLAKKTAAKKAAA
jgi:DNA-binding protein HU-beta